jgi:hypothetical protein
MSGIGKVLEQAHRPNVAATVNPRLRERGATRPQMPGGWLIKKVLIAA